MNEVNNTQTYQKQLDEIFCRSCGKPIKKEAEICPYCGVRQKADKKKKSKKKIFIIIGALIFISIVIGIIAGEENNNSSSSSNSNSKEDREARENSRIVEMKGALSELKDDYDEFNQTIFYSQKRFTAYRNANHFELNLAISTDYKLKSVSVNSCIVYKDTILGISELVFLYGTNTYKFNTGFQSFDAGLTPDWKYYSYFGKTLIFEEEKFINYLENFSKANTAKIQYRGLGGMRTERTLTKNEKLGLQDVIKAYKRIKEINKEYGI